MFQNNDLSKKTLENNQDELNEPTPDINKQIIPHIKNDYLLCQMNKKIENDSLNFQNLDSSLNKNINLQNFPLGENSDQENLKNTKSSVIFTNSFIQISMLRANLIRNLLNKKKENLLKFFFENWKQKTKNFPNNNSFPFNSINLQTDLENITNEILNNENQSLEYNRNNNKNNINFDYLNQNRKIIQNYIMSDTDDTVSNIKDIPLYDNNSIKMNNRNNFEYFIDENLEQDQNYEEKNYNISQKNNFKYKKSETKEMSNNYLVDSNKKNEIYNFPNKTNKYLNNHTEKNNKSNSNLILINEYSEDSQNNSNRDNSTQENYNNSNNYNIPLDRKNSSNNLPKSNSFRSNSNININNNNNFEQNNHLNFLVDKINNIFINKTKDFSYQFFLNLFKITLKEKSHNFTINYLKIFFELSKAKLKLNKNEKIHPDGNLNINPQEFSIKNEFDQNISKFKSEIEELTLINEDISKRLKDGEKRIGKLEQSLS